MAGRVEARPRKPLVPYEYGRLLLVRGLAVARVWTSEVELKKNVLVAADDMAEQWEWKRKEDERVGLHWELTNPANKVVNRQRVEK